jgi:hypothetical protein
MLDVGVGDARCSVPAQQQRVLLASLLEFVPEFADSDGELADAGVFGRVAGPLPSGLPLAGDGVVGP